jgi:hypothetical protein
VVEGLVRHGFFGELSIGFVGVGYECYAASVEDSYWAEALVWCAWHEIWGRWGGLTPFDLAPFGEMARNDLFDIVGDVYPSDVDCSVLPHEASHAAHVVSVVTVLVSSKHIHVRVEHIVYSWKPVQVFALLTFGTDATGEEQAKVRTRDFVSFGVSTVLHDITSAYSGGLGKVFIFAVTA